VGDLRPIRPPSSERSYREVSPRAEDREEDGAPPRNRSGAEKQIHSAAFWLRQTVLVDLVASAICCCPATGPRSSSNPDAFVVFFLMMLIFFYLPLLYVGIGAYHLRIRRSYRLAFTGGVLAMVLSVQAFIQAFLGMVIAGESQFIPHRVGCGVVFLTLLALYGSVIGCVAGIKTLLVLSRPEVRRTFR
jgi:hypothetical protein